MGADAAPQKKSFFKLVVGGFLGLCAGAGTMYFNAVFNTVVRPPKPVANFAVSADGLTVTCQNRASGQSGWWDFGDGTPLEPFDPDTQTVSHTYAKPGSYAVKLIVRNFLLDENDRSVSVDLTAPAATAAAAPPKLLNVKVEPIREQLPATYRITGEVQNADEIMLAVGDKREHLPAEPKLDRYVTIDKAGQVSIVLAAMTKSKATPDVFVVPAVTVSNPQKPVYDVRLEVTDVVTRAEPRTQRAMLPVPIKDPQGKATPGFSRTLPADPGCTIKAAAFDVTRTKHAALVKNVQTKVAADGKSVTVTGEWANPNPDTTAKAAGGGEVFIPVTLTEERVTTSSPGKSTPTFVLGDNGRGSFPLPPAPPGVQRTIAVAVGYTEKDGKRTPLASGTLDASGNWTAPVPQFGPSYSVQAATANGQVQVAIANTPASAPSAAPPAAKPATPPAKPTAGKK